MNRMEVTSSEYGLVRLFAVDLAPSEIDAFRERRFDDDDTVHWPLQTALGGRYLDEDFIELFNIDDLEGLGLRGYMTEGLGIAASDLAEDAARLDALTGPVLIVLSSAFDGIAQTLTPRAPLRWLGTYREDSAPVQFTPLPSQAAKGVLDTSAPAQSNPHLTLLLALLALPVAFALLAVLAFVIFK